MSFTVNFTGQSGKQYTYWNLVSIAPDGIQPVAGNYCFAKQLPNGNFMPVYFGVADNLQNRIPNHERLEEARRAGATYVLAHSTPGGEQARCDEERDLIRYWNPTLNVQHRTTG